MGIFDGLGSLFSGSAGKKASEWQMNQLRQTGQQATGAIDQGVGQALPYLVGPGGAADNVRGGYGQALNTLSSYYPETQGYLGQATSAYAPMAGFGLKGVEAYSDATGVNGAEGAQRARAAFQADPGYEWQREQGLDALTRTANARGMLGSGNTSTDILKYSQGLADQTYGNYVTRLMPLMEMYKTGVAGQAAGLGAQGGASQNYATNVANTQAGQGNAVAGVNTNAANLYNTSGTNKANVLNSIGQQIGQVGAQGMMAEQQGAANLLSTLMGVGTLGVSLAGGGGLGGIGRTLSNPFGMPRGF